MQSHNGVFFEFSEFFLFCYIFSKLAAYDFAYRPTIRLCYVMFFFVFSVFGVLLQGSDGFGIVILKSRGVERKKISGSLSLAMILPHTMDLIFTLISMYVQVADKVEKLNEFSTCACGKPLTAVGLCVQSAPGCQDNDSPPANVAPSFALKNKNIADDLFIYYLFTYIHTYLLILD